MNIPVPQINALFAPRPPIEFIPPIDVQIKKKKRNREMHGIGGFTQYLETGVEYDEIMKSWKPIEQRPERRARIREERKTMCDETLAEKAAAWDPSSYSYETDAYKTLFIARLNFMTDEHKIKRDMEQVCAPLSSWIAAGARANPAGKKRHARGLCGCVRGGRCNRILTACVWWAAGSTDRSKTSPWFTTRSRKSPAGMVLSNSSTSAT